MIDNEILKKKVAKELKKLKLTEQQEDIVVKELNYLANLLIDIYIDKTKGGEQQNGRRKTETSKQYPESNQ